MKGRIIHNSNETEIAASKGFTTTTYTINSDMAAYDLLPAPIRRFLDQESRMKFSSLEALDFYDSAPDWMCVDQRIRHTLNVMRKGESAIVTALFDEK